jgi:predicted RNA-binding Zn ribbon-like protein
MQFGWDDRKRVAMKKEIRGAGERVDGFLFVGNHLALDLVNTRIIPDQTSVELLPDTVALEKWLMAAGLVTSAKGKGLVRRWRNSEEARRFLTELRSFRERLRATVIQHEAGAPISPRFLAELNRLLEAYPARMTLSAKDGKLQREMRFEPSTPREVWAPIIAATADLLTDVEPSRIRKCESCIMHFYDISKKSSRRWCSMNICGNRVKVAAYRQRQRAVE